VKLRSRSDYHSGHSFARRIRPSQRRRIRRIIFIGLLVSLAAVLGWAFWQIRRGPQPEDPSTSRHDELLDLRRRRP
jgi:hypothetical protein